METNELTPEDAAKLSVVGKKYFHLIEFDKDEQLVAEIRKHPIGLFFIYLTGIGISLVMAILFGILGLSDFLATGLDGTGASSSSAQAIIVLVGMLLEVIGYSR